MLQAKRFNIWKICGKKIRKKYVANLLPFIYLPDENVQT